MGDVDVAGDWELRLYAACPHAADGGVGSGFAGWGHPAFNQGLIPQPPDVVYVLALETGNWRLGTLESKTPARPRAP
jgi:hypothetical protein